MGKQEIIRLFIEKGLQVDPPSLELFDNDSEKLAEFLKKIPDKGKLPTRITIDFVKKILQTHKFEILQGFNIPQQTHTIENAVHYFNNRYETMKKFFVDKPSLENLISINKITDKVKKFSIIAMVKEKDEHEKTIVVEDQTGEILVWVESNDFEQIVPDEVLGLVCENNAVPKAVNVVFPDVPLKREVTKTSEEVFCLFISDFHFESEDFNKKHYEKFLEWLKKSNYPNLYIFVLGGISSKKDVVKEFFSQLPDSTKIYMMDENDAEFSADYTIKGSCLARLDDVVILLCSGDTLAYYIKLWSNLTVKKVMLNLLKKRHLDPVFTANKKIFDKDLFVMETLPDIFVSPHFHQPGELNYKGTTILSLGSFTQQPIFWLANLKTREIIKLDFT